MLKRIFAIIILCAIALWVTIDHDNVVSKSRRVLSWVTSKTSTPELSINETDIIEATNKERVDAGLPPLSTNKYLNNSAEAKVDDMIAKQYFEHQSPTGESVSDLGKKAGYQYVIMGENLALGNFTSSQDIVDAWMNSPGHRANILNNKYQDIGVSVKQAKYEGKEMWFAVQHFGTSRAICPDIDESLKQEIDDINTALKAEEGEIAQLKKALEAPGAQSNPSYQDLIRQFNTAVDDYNSKLSTSREKIETYNAAVRSFNKCIATFQ